METKQRNKKQDKEVFFNIFSKHTCVACSAAIPSGRGIILSERNLEVCNELCKKNFLNSDGDD